MEFPKLQIAPAKESKGDNSKKAAKTRTFCVRRLTYLRADPLWEPKKGKVSEIRPALLCFLGSRAETQAFSANLMAGRPAVCGNQAFIIERKTGYRWLSQDVPGGVVTTVYLPRLFHLEPVVETERVGFVFAPPNWWIREQARELRMEVPGEDPEELAQAALFAAFLDRRTSMPILREARFQLRLFREAQNEPFITALDDRYDFDGAGFGPCGIVSPLAVSVSPEALITFIKTQIEQYKEHTHGAPRSTTVSRILSYPEAPTEQLGLDFAVG